MGLQINATRKYPLKGFAEGWDNCYLIVRVASETQRKKRADEMAPYNDEMAAALESHDEKAINVASTRLDEVAETLTRDFANDLIIGGIVINTKDDGTNEAVEISKEDIPVVVDALGFAWVKDIIEVATGADRLKAQMTSLA